MGCTPSREDDKFPSIDNADYIHGKISHKPPVGDSSINLEISGERDYRPEPPPDPSSAWNSLHGDDSLEGNGDPDAQTSRPESLEVNNQPAVRTSSARSRSPARMPQLETVHSGEPKLTASDSQLTAYAGSAKPTAVSLIKGRAPKVAAAMLELLETERVYVRVLHLLVDRYMAVLKSLLEADELSVIFGNCAMIKGVNEALLSQLERAFEATPKPDELPTPAGVAASFAAIFIRMLPFLKSYATYCSGYFSALEKLTSLRAERNGVDAALKAIEAEAAKEGAADMRLTSCLIRPVKRLTLYPLLLSALLRAVVGADPANETNATQHAQLEQANSSVHSIAESVNSMVRDAESRVKMLEVHERLHGADPSLIAPSRRFVTEAMVVLRKRGAGASGQLGPPKEHKLWLLSDKLLLARPDRFSDQFFHLKENFDIDTISVSAQPPARGATNSSASHGADGSFTVDMLRVRTLGTSTASRATLDKKESTISSASSSFNTRSTRASSNRADAPSEAPACAPAAVDSNVSPQSTSPLRRTPSQIREKMKDFWVSGEAATYHVSMSGATDVLRKLFAAIVAAQAEYARTTKRLAAIRANALEEKQDEAQLELNSKARSLTLPSNGGLKHSKQESSSSIGSASRLVPPLKLSPCGSNAMADTSSCCAHPDDITARFSSMSSSPRKLNLEAVGERRTSEEKAARSSGDSAAGAVASIGAVDLQEAAYDNVLRLRNTRVSSSDSTAPPPGGTSSG